MFAIWKSQVSNLFIRVRRFCSKTASRFHDLVSNDPILDPKVVPDELGPLAEPGWPGLASQAARSCRRGPGWPPPGGPGHHSTDPRTAENALTAPASRRGCARSGRARPTRARPPRAGCSLVGVKRNAERYMFCIGQTHRARVGGGLGLHPRSPLVTKPVVLALHGTGGGAMAHTGPPRGRGGGGSSRS